MINYYKKLKKFKKNNSIPFGIFNNHGKKISALTTGCIITLKLIITATHAVFHKLKLDYQKSKIF